MAGIPHQRMLDAGVHFGHLRKKWNPRMLPYIFMEHRGIHIIDLNRTNEALIRAAEAMKKIARGGGKILFVATKKQAKDIVANLARQVGMPYATERWPGGMLTNFVTIRKSIKKMQGIDQLLDQKADALTKKERLMLSREREKLNRDFGGIASMNRPPKAMFIVDISHEHIALAEAKKLGIPVFAMVDTNSDPTKVDFPIPSNDDASKSVQIISSYLAEAVREGLAEREAEIAENKAIQADQEGKQDDKGGDRRTRRRRSRGRRRNKVDDGAEAANTTEQVAATEDAKTEQPPVVQETPNPEPPTADAPSGEEKKEDA